MSQKSVINQVVTALFCVSEVLWGTDRYFPDLQAMSPNLKYRVQAKSSDKQDSTTPRPFQSNFVYSLVDIERQVNIWTRRQSTRYDMPLEPSPVGLFVDNKGWVVIWNALDELVAVDYEGKDTGKIDILADALPKDEVAKYADWTTAGWMWGASFSFFYFVDLDGQDCFCVRTWWGTRILMDLRKGSQIAVTSSAIPQLAAHEKALVLETLETAVRDKHRIDMRNADGRTRELLRAAYLAGAWHFEDAVPLLTQIEQLEIVGKTIDLRTQVYRPFPGKTSVSCWRELTLRRVVQLSLRRLGHAPALYPATQFCRDGASGRTFLPTVPPAQPRKVSVRLLRKEMKPEEVLDLMGAPDFNDSRRWYFDVDDERPFGVILTWAQDGLQGIEQRSPPFWQTDTYDRVLIKW